MDAYDDHPTDPIHRQRRRRRPLVATLLVVSLVLAGCGSTGTSGEVDAAPRSVGGDGGGAGGGPTMTARPGGPPRAGSSTGNLDPDLLAAVETAARAARDDGIELSITSGWRSREHQQRLFDEAVAEHGSEEEARRYVSPPDLSAHVTGDAVDIGPTDADYWLIQHGSDYGLCQVFANEVWHFELATTPGGRCPDLLPDSSDRG